MQHKSILIGLHVYYIDLVINIMYIQMYSYFQGQCMPPPHTHIHHFPHSTIYILPLFVSPYNLIYCNKYLYTLFNNLLNFGNLPSYLRYQLALLYVIYVILLLLWHVNCSLFLTIYFSIDQFTSIRKFNVNLRFFP